MLCVLKMGSKINGKKSGVPVLPLLFGHCIEFMYIDITSILIINKGACKMANSKFDTSLQINARQNRGILSPYVLGSMYEWESNEMNDTWAEMAMARSYETETVTAYNPPLYDHFSGDSLARSKWSPILFGGAVDGSYQVGGSNLQISAPSGNSYGLSTSLLQDTKWNDITVKAALTGYTGNVFVSVFSGSGSPYQNYIETGIQNGEAVIRYLSNGNVVQIPYQGENDLSAPITFYVMAGHVTDSGRTFSFRINNGPVTEVPGFISIGDEYKAMLYCEANSQASWDSVSIYRGRLYDSFDSSSSRFAAGAYNGGSGSLTFTSGALNVFSTGSGTYGALSPRIRNSAVDWSEISVTLNSVIRNGMITLFGDEEFGSYIQFGVEDGSYKVYTSSGYGDRVIEKLVALPATLRIQVPPYYSNGRSFRFFVDGEIVHYIADSKDLPAPDYRIYLSSGGQGSGSSWDEVRISREHFIDPMGPHFEGVGLPGDYAETTINGGAYGTLNVYGGFLDLYGVSGSKYGVTVMPFHNSDIKPYKFCALLTQCEGQSGMLYITTGNARGDYVNFVEFGVVNGQLTVNTPTGSWTGGAVQLPVVLDVYVSAYGQNGRNISFVCNGEPVYYLENFTGLEAKDVKLALYGDGDTHTQWDYCGAYPYEAWIEDGYDAGAIYSLDDTDSVSGRYGISMDIRENRGAKGISQPAVSVIAGHNYVISVWLKRDGEVDPVRIQIGPNEPLGPDYIPYGTLQLGIIGTAYSKYIGSIQVSTTDINAKLSLLASGNGKLWADQISLMPTHESEVAANGFRRDFVDKLTALNPKNLRWPGGIIADWYDFKNGIGADRDRRPPQYFAQWNASWLNNDVGVDEFLRLCETLGIDPTLNVNYGTGTPEEARDFVEYVNGAVTTPMGSRRQLNGHTEPYGVKFWEVGNETWGWWTPGNTDAVTFANRALEYITLMRQADPAIRLIAEGADGNSYQQGWNCAVMGIAGDVIDELSTHYYSPQGLPPNYNDEAVYWASVGSPQSVEERLHLAMNIATVTGKDVKYAITEYNAMYFNSPIRRTRTMEAAMQVAGLLHAFLRYPGATGHNNYSCLANFWDGSSMHTGQRGIFVIPSYYVLELLANKRGEIVVEGIAASETYSTAGPIGNTPQLHDVPYLDVLVTRSLDGAKLYISILNRDKDQAWAAPIVLNGLQSVSAAATVYVVTSQNYLDTNSFINPDFVTPQISQINNVSMQFSYDAPPMSYTVLELDVTGLPAITAPILCGLAIDSNCVGIPGANVSVNGAAAGVTDDRGYFQIPESEGEYTVEVSKPGYVASTMNHVYLYGNGVTCQPIRLLFANVLTDGAEVAISSAISGKLLSLETESTNDGVAVVQKTADGTAIQKWIVHAVSDGSYYFLNAYSGKAMSIAEGSAVIAGGYYFLSAYNGKDVTTADGSYFEGGRIVQRTYTGDLDQHWIVEQFEEGCRFTNRLNSLCLDLPNGASDENLFVQTWYDNGNIAQRWTIIQ